MKKLMKDEDEMTAVIEPRPKKKEATMIIDGTNVEVRFRARLSFVDVFEPKEGKNDDGTPNGRLYRSVNALLDKTEDTQAIGVIREAMKKARELQWGTNPPVIKAECMCLQDGEPVDPTTLNDDGTGGVRKPRYEGYANQLFLSANKLTKSKTEPNNVQLLGPRKTAKDSNGNPIFPILVESDGLIYSGVWADVIVRIYGYDNKGQNHPHRINASLEALKHVQHGTAFGAKKVDAQSAFDEEDDDDMPETQSGGAASGAAAGADFDPLA